MPRSGLPSQWPRDFDSFFGKLCSSVEVEPETWKGWAMQEQCTRTAYGFCYINLFRHILTLDADGRISALKPPGPRPPFPSQAWLASSGVTFEANNEEARIRPNQFCVHSLEKKTDRLLFLTRNAFYFQVVLLHQAYSESLFARMAQSDFNASGTHDKALWEEGRTLTSRFDDIFACPTISKLRTEFWKPDVLALFLLHQALALHRIQPVTVLCQLAESNASFQVAEREASRAFWRAAQIFQAVQHAPSKQRQQLIVPYALFVSVMFMVSLSFPY